MSNDQEKKYCIVYYDDGKSKISDYNITNFKFHTLNYCKNKIKQIINKILLHSTHLMSTTAKKTKDRVDYIYYKNNNSLSEILEYSTDFLVLSYITGNAAKDLLNYQICFICEKDEILNRTFLPSILSILSNSELIRKYTNFAFIYKQFDSFLSSNKLGNKYSNLTNICTTDNEFWKQIDDRVNSLDERYILNAYNIKINSNNLSNYRRLTLHELSMFQKTHRQISSYDPSMSCDWVIEITVFDGDYDKLEEGDILFEYNGVVYDYFSDFD